MLILIRQERHIMLFHCHIFEDAAGDASDITRSDEDTFVKEDEVINLLETFTTVKGFAS